MSSGVFAVARSIWDDPDFAAEAFTEREAMIWLVGAAAWKEQNVRGTAGPVMLARGEFCFSVRFLAEKWEWSKSRVARFIRKLETRAIIRDASRDGSKVYSLRNYSRYQVVGLPKRDAGGDSKRDESGTAAGQERDKEETLKHSNIKTTPPPPSGGPLNELFGEFKFKWGVSDVCRPSAEAEFAKLGEVDRRAALGGIPDYLAETVELDRKRCSATTYLAERRWEGVKRRSQPKASGPKPQGFRLFAGDHADHWQAWEAYFRAQVAKDRRAPATGCEGNSCAEMLSLMRSRQETGRPIRVSSEWPPADREPGP